MPDNRVFPFKLGADPEFNFVVQNRHTGRLRADSLMKDFFSDKRPTSGGFNIAGGNAGWDGNSATGEIRPKPENSPSGLTANIGKMYAEICKRSPSAVKISVRSDTAPVGGHIHFELDEESKNMSDAKARIVQKRLSTFYTPIALGEDQANQALRLQTSYGRFNDFRRENGKTYEYRTPSAEWQLTPKICEATLAYLGTVWFEAVHRPKSFTKLEALYPNDRAGNAVQQLLMSRYTLLGKAIIGEIKKVIKNFEYYPMFKDEIDYILNYEKVLKDKQKSLFCINLGWEFQESRQPTKKLINNETQIRKRLNNIDIDRWLELFKIPYNPDTNVKDFVDALKRRILAFDWNLKNEYYMFGMRKGIAKPIVMNGNFQFVVGGDQIKTIRDRDAVVETFKRMKQRMQRAFRVAPEKSMIIGLPYDDRMKKNIRPLIEMIYDMEKTEVEASIHKDSELKNDVEEPQENWGEIARAYASSDEGNMEMEEAANRIGDSELRELLENERDENACSHCGAPNGDCDCKDHSGIMRALNKSYCDWCVRHGLAPTAQGFEHWVDNHAYELNN